MSNVVSIVLWILQFATKAIIMVGRLFRHMLTGGTTPTFIRFRTVCPFDDARQMDDVKTIAT